MQRKQPSKKREFESTWELAHVEFEHLFFPVFSYPLHMQLPGWPRKLHRLKDVG